MESPNDQSIYAKLRVPDTDGTVHVFIESSVLSGLESNAQELVFIMVLSRRYQILFDRVARELINAIPSGE
jgi:hypothetical protein